MKEMFVIILLYMLRNTDIDIIVSGHCKTFVINTSKTKTLILQFSSHARHFEATKRRRYGGLVVAVNPGMPNIKVILLKLMQKCFYRSL